MGCRNLGRHLIAGGKEPGTYHSNQMFIVSEFFYSLLRGSRDVSHLAPAKRRGKSGDARRKNIASLRNFFRVLTQNTLNLEGAKCRFLTNGHFVPPLVTSTNTVGFHFRPSTYNQTAICASRTPT